MIKHFYKYFIRTYLFWMLFFAIHRLIFILFNLKYAQSDSFWYLVKSFAYGTRLDLSYSGYVMLLVFLMQMISLIITQRFCFKCIDYFTRFFAVVFTIVLLADTNLFSYWSRHLSADVIPILKTPSIIFLNMPWYHSVFFIGAVGLVSGIQIILFNKIAVREIENQFKYSGALNILGLELLLAFSVTATILLPIRGSFGVAPINTGVAYFSKDAFANEAAVNPLWKFVFALKDARRNQLDYNYLPDNQAESIFDGLMKESGNYPKILSIEKPNVVILLLESFAAHNIKELGGYDVTPNFSKLTKEGILFSQIYAASNRSDKGLLATFAGYQVLPKFNIIRYPEKTLNLPNLPKEFKKAGYQDLMYMYGGDIKFMNMDSFVAQSGFDKVITEDDFESEQTGEKWGVHDEFTFRRLVREMEESNSPYFKFFFTLSSHEPFVVPMERVHENDYHNSIAYLDKCLGEFFDTVKVKGLWDNTLFVLIADHGVGGPDNYTTSALKFKHIPMLWTGGALAVKDTIVSTIGSQTDLARTLLCQLDIDNKAFKFSKNLFDSEVHPFAFFDYNDDMGMVEEDLYQVYNFQKKDFTRFEGNASSVDSLKAKAYLQILSQDQKQR